MKFTASRDAWIVIGIFVAIIILGVAGGGHYGKSTATGPAHAEQAFAPGGSVSLDLEAGDYEIVNGSDDKIVVDGRADRSRDVHATVDVTGNTAHIVTQAADNSDAHFRIELPAKSDINLHLTAGDLRISGLEGNKDIENKAGDVTIDVGDPSKYGNVEATSLAGDITATPFGRSTSGVGNDFSWTGSGPYHLRVHLLAGDLVLH